ncbi:MAG TPA: copper homeostasis protein CutC [Gemmatimonadaceae bacterium]|nr:copper homeostasis protein CutC [Gemmatimonadaceae bacterium]
MADEQRVLVEACVDSVASSVAAERGGAGRLELCDALFDGGTTPSAGMIAACNEAVSIPVFVIIRPRGGGFVYSDVELDVMRRDIVAARGLGADGVVIGPLGTDGRVHEAQTRALVDAAADIPVTFHRAFDFVPDLDAALATLMKCGVTRVLSSGGAATAREGAPKLASLVSQAGTRMTVMAGGSVREEHVRELVGATGVREVHVRLTRLTRGDGPPAPPGVRVRKSLPDDEAAWEETDEGRVRSFVRALGMSALAS